MTQPQTSLRPILVPVNFSPSSAENLLVAAELAAQRGCPLMVLHVIHDRSDHPGFYHKRPYLPSYPIRDRARQMMDDFLAEVAHRHHQSHPIEHARVMMVEGVPATRIAEVALAQDVQLIVLTGRRGRELFHRDIAERISCSCDTPLMILHPAPRPSPKRTGATGNSRRRPATA